MDIRDVVSLRVMACWRPYPQGLCSTGSVGLCFPLALDYHIKSCVCSCVKQYFFSVLTYVSVVLIPSGNTRETTRSAGGECAGGSGRGGKERAWITELGGVDGRGGCRGVGRGL